MSGSNINQVYIANPITANIATDLMYFGQSPYGITNDAAMTYANFSAQFIVAPGSLAQGDILYYTGSAWAVLAPGTSGNVLTTQGAAANPIWASGGGGSPWTAGSGTNSAIGGDGSTVAAGNYSLSYGSNSTSASGLNSYAFGSAVTASGNYSLALGQGGTTAGGTDSIAIGNFARANNAYCLAIGNSVLASNAYDIAIGQNTTASGSHSLALGYGTSALGAFGFARGFSATSNNAGSYVIGDSNPSPNTDTAANQLCLTFAGGYYLYVGSTLSLEINTAGAVSLLGDASGASASAGFVGQVISSTVTYASSTAYTSGNITNITSISLTAGDWDIFGNAGIAGTAVSEFEAAISTSSGALGNLENRVDIYPLATSPVCTSPVPGIPVTISSTTTYYLVVSSSVSGSPVMFGNIYARRRR